MTIQAQPPIVSVQRLSDGVPRSKGGSRTVREGKTPGTEAGLQKRDGTREAPSRSGARGDANWKDEATKRATPKAPLTRKSAQLRTPDPKGHSLNEEELKEGEPGKGEIGTVKTADFKAQLKRLKEEVRKTRKMLQQAAEREDAEDLRQLRGGLQNRLKETPPVIATSTATAARLLSCTVCRENFTSSAALYGHFGEQHTDSLCETAPSPVLLRCPICSKDFFETNVFEDHLQKRHKSKTAALGRVEAGGKNGGLVYADRDGAGKKGTSCSTM